MFTDNEDSGCGDPKIASGMNEPHCNKFKNGVEVCVTDWNYAFNGTRVGCDCSEY